MSKNVVAAAFALSLTCLPAKADIITITETGTAIGSGGGVWGLFNNFSAMPFTAVWIFDPTLGGSYHDSSRTVGGGAYGPTITSPMLSASLTINGHTETINGSYYGEVYLSANQMIFQAQNINPSEYLASSFTNNSNLFPTTFTSFGPLNMSQIGGNTSFQFNEGLNRTYGNLNVTNIAMSVAPPVGVPGPIVGAGIPGLLALFGMGALYWRRKQLAG